MQDNNVNMQQNYADIQKKVMKYQVSPTHNYQYLSCNLFMSTCDTYIHLC